MKLTKIPVRRFQPMGLLHISLSDIRIYHGFLFQKTGDKDNLFHKFRYLFMNITKKVRKGIGI